MVLIQLAHILLVLATSLILVSIATKWAATEMHPQLEELEAQTQLDPTILVLPISWTLALIAITTAVMETLLELVVPAVLT